MITHRWMWLSVALVVALGLGAVADYAPQPPDWHSYIECYEGTMIYDDELAALIAQVAVSHGYGSFVFVFTQCYSGGMLDDLGRALHGVSDVALMSASRHDEVAWRAVTTDRPACLRRSGLSEPEGYFAAVVARALARAGDDRLLLREVWRVARDEGAARPGGPATQPEVCPGASLVDPPEHAQWLALGEGEALSLGFDAAGREVPFEARHAVLFVGDGDSIADWNDLDLIYEVLGAHGFAPEHVIVLAGPGPGGAAELIDPQSWLHTVPPYVDGPGTRDALLHAFDALPPVIGANGQLFFWVGGHGDQGPAIPWDEAIALTTAYPARGRFTEHSPLLQDDSPYSVYVFEGAEGDPITLTMTSRELDAFLWLYDDARQVLAIDDDSAGGTDARITHVLPYDGTYYVLANAFDAHERGIYWIELEVTQAEERARPVRWRTWSSEP